MTIEQILVQGTLLAAFAFALATTAAIAFWRMARIGELVPYEPGPRAKTGLLEFALVFSAFVAGQAFGALAARPFLPASERTMSPSARRELPGELPADPSVAPRPLDSLTLFAAGAGSLAAVLALYVVWRRVFDRGPRTLAPAKRLSTLRSDIGLGFWAFLMSAPLVYGLQALLSPLFPQKHEILLRFQAGLDPTFLLAAGFAAAVAAPVCEEILFRGFLQSAFQGLRCRREGRLNRLFFGTPFDGAGRTHPDAEPTHESPVEFRRRGGTPGEGLRRTLAGFGSPAVVASATIFALMHLGQGAAPIPLFFFALMLGYLYRQTGRLAAPVACHFGLNGTTILLAGLSLLNGAPPPADRSDEAVEARRIEPKPVPPAVALDREGASRATPRVR